MTQPADSSSNPSTEGLRVLLADDDPIAQRTIQRMLEKRGFVVTTAANGVEALAAVGRGAIDLVLMDMQMPQMGGWHAAVAIRDQEREKGGHLPIIALTASTAPGDRETCLAAGMDGYLSKPVSAEQLLGEIAAARRAPSS